MTPAGRILIVSIFGFLPGVPAAAQQASPVETAETCLRSIFKTPPADLRVAEADAYCRCIGEQEVAADFANLPEPARDSIRPQLQNMCIAYVRNQPANAQASPSPGAPAAAPLAPPALPQADAPSAPPPSGIATATGPQPQRTLTPLPAAPVPIPQSQPAPPPAAMAAQTPEPQPPEPQEPAPEPQTPSLPSFDRFLTGFTRCDMSPEFNTFWRAAAERFNRGLQIKQNVKIPLPRDLAAAIHISKATAKPIKDEYTDVRIPVQGQWLGVPIKSIEFAMGIENGISVTVIVFDAPRSEMIRAFGPAVRRGQAILKRQNMDGAEQSIDFLKDRAAIVCDSST